MADVRRYGIQLLDGSLTVIEADQVNPYAPPIVTFFREDRVVGQCSMANVQLWFEMTEISSAHIKPAKGDSLETT